MTFLRVKFSRSRHSNPTSRCSRGCNFQHRGVGIQCHNVPKSYTNMSLPTWRHCRELRLHFFSQRRDVIEKKTQLFEKKFSKVKSTPLFRFHSLPNADFNFPSYLSIIALISKPENKTTRISNGLRENFHL